ncbi:hypothetical protein MRX96_056801 [Rhipicephalus microplus]
MAAPAGPPGFDEEADNWEAYRLRLEAYFEVHDVTDEKKRRMRSTPQPLAKLETLFGTGTTAGVVQTPAGHRMATIKATDGEHHRRHYDQLRGRETDITGLAAGEAEINQEPGVEAPQTEAGETGAPLTSREPQSPGLRWCKLTGAGFLLYGQLRDEV